MWVSFKHSRKLKEQFSNRGKAQYREMHNFQTKKILITYLFSTDLLQIENQNGKSQDPSTIKVVFVFEAKGSLKKTETTKFLFSR